MFIQQTSGNLWKEYSSGLSVPGYVLGVVAADLNQDTHNDIIFATCTPSDGNGLRVWLGNSGGATGTSFTWTAANTGLPTTRRYAQIQAVDIDSDNDLDIIGPCASGSKGMKIFLGNGSTKPGKWLGWTEATNTNLPEKGDWYGANCYDINGDGSLDIVGASWGMGVRAWLNNLSMDTTPPGGVSDLTAVENTYDSIKVSWTAPADNGTETSSGPVKSYDIRYSTSTINLGNWGTALQCSGEPVPAAPGNTQEFNITGLQSATQYFIALRSEDEIPNRSPLSNIVINTTLGELDTTPPGTITDLAAANPTSSSIELTWSAPADNDSDASSGPALEYDIRYANSVITDLTWSLALRINTPPTPGSPGTAESYIVESLQSETSYYFAVKARDERPNWGLLSNCPTETTLPEPDLTPPDAVSDLTADNPTLSSIDLSWTAVGDDSGTGTAGVYDIRYSLATITDANWQEATQCSGEPTPQSAGTTEHFQVTGLSSDTTYYFALKAGDETPLWSDLSNIASLSTLPEPDVSPPGIITDLQAIQPTHTTITLTWTSPGDDEYIDLAQAYQIKYALEEITESNWDSSADVPEQLTPQSAGNVETLVVTGLELNTTYYFAIKTADEVPNWSPVSNSPHETTLDITKVPPELVVNLAAEKYLLDATETIELEIDVKSKLDLLPISDVTIIISSNSSEVIINPFNAKTDADGVLTVKLTAPPVSAPTAVEVYVQASKQTYLPNETSAVITINPVEESELRKFNLRITEEDITFSNDVPTEGDEITIYAYISNVGLLNATGFLVKFFVDDIQLGNDENITELLRSEHLVLQKTWGSVPGSHKVRVELIPWHSIFEDDLSDNTAERSISVQDKVIDDDPPDDVIDEEPDNKPEGSSTDEKSRIDPFHLILAIIAMDVPPQSYISQESVNEDEEMEE
jgi:hypothetical protein